ncbi:hypothetical protein XH89_20225 [Bradyrhizobium sp. CCBAU 53340]|nr:hypothetical protein XH89_20225 [Bradyrhizobium sp. CCBAU 53340]
MLNIVVDRFDQRARVAEHAFANEIAAQPIQLGELDFDRPRPRLCRKLALSLFMPRLRGCSVLCLGHAAIETRRRRESNCRFLAVRNARELPPVVGVEDSARRSLEEDRDDR